uniref:RPA-interacting protein C-terminal domain-containing protein n=1 Tax=Graphocephala atropunctata TaxID=36148 RepID=A0A1B6KWX4_9HEMI
MFSDTLISPRADRDIRKRSAKYKKRTDSPNFKDILRQRCRERVKARREAMFDQLRSLKDENCVRNALAQFIESDLKELHLSQTLTESCDEAEMLDPTANNEPLSQLAVSATERWILEEYDRLIEGTDAQVEMGEAVVCPLCARGVLSDNPVVGVVTCSLCSLVLPLTVPAIELESLIEKAVDGHGRFCGEQANFTVCPDDATSSLLMMCCVCGYVQQVV